MEGLGAAAATSATPRKTPAQAWHQAFAPATTDKGADGQGALQPAGRSFASAPPAHLPANTAPDDGCQIQLQRRVWGNAAEGSRDGEQRCPARRGLAGRRAGCACPRSGLGGSPCFSTLRTPDSHHHVLAIQAAAALTVGHGRFEGDAITVPPPAKAARMGNHRKPPLTAPSLWLVG